MEVVITGGTGLVGKTLTEALVKRGYNVCILTRNPSKYSSSDKVRYAHWDPAKSEIDVGSVQNARYIIHLAGEGIADERWTRKYKSKILNSRLESSKLLADTITKHSVNLKGIVSASAIGWYGEDSGKDIFRENDPAANDFLGEVCRRWEESISLQPYPVAKLRTGIVFANNGGAYTKLTRPVRYGIAAIPGSGKQVMSWIHIQDLVRLYITAMEGCWQGSFNAVSPSPLTQRYLIFESAKKIKGKFFIPLYVPKFLLKLLLGGSAAEVLKSCTVSCEKVSSEGFTFQYPTLASCISDLTSSKIIS